MSKYFIFLFAFLFTAINLIIAQSSKISSEKIKEHVYTLASEKFMGREAGSDFEYLSVNYIQEYLESLKFDNVQTDYFVFDVDLDYGEDNFLNSNGKNYKLNEDYTVVSISANKKLSADLVFCGYGYNFSDNSIKWNDFESIDIKGKWVIILRGTPIGISNQEIFEKFSTDYFKIRTAADNGAGGIILVSPESFDPDDNLMKLKKNQGRINVPVIHVKRNVVNELIKNSKHRIEDYEKIIIEKNKPWSISIKNKVNCSVDLKVVDSQSTNILTYIVGKNTKLQNEFILIGAHYDHLGLGGEGSSSRRPDTLAVHYGADDNASGVALLLELASYFKKSQNQLERSIIFIAFGGEEKGLLGSKFFVEHPFTDLKNIIIMINLDMVGRLKPDNYLNIGGTGTFVSADSILYLANEDGFFKLDLSPEGYGPSDHAAFYAKDIPVLFFTTGAHADYHTPFDTPEKINYNGISNIGEYVIRVINEIDKTPQRPVFTEAGPKTTESNRNPNLKVSFGIMPDHTTTGIKGLRAEIVTPGKPAFKAGMKNGDIIKAINGMPINDIHDYMFRLSKLNPGESVNVDIERDGEHIVLIIQL